MHQLRSPWCRVVCPGSSSEQPGYAVDDLHGLVEHLRLPPFHLIGTAAGGVVAFDFVISYPSLVRTLVIADTIGGVQDREHMDVQNRLHVAGNRSSAN